MKTIQERLASTVLTLRIAKQEVLAPANPRIAGWRPATRTQRWSNRGEGENKAEFELEDLSVLEELYDRPSANSQLAVTIYVRSQGALIAWDYGLVSFCEGWLLYQGLRTSFQLHRAHVASHKLPWFDHAGHRLLDYEVRSCKFTLDLLPYARFREGYKVGMEFDTEFRRWEATPIAWPGGAPIYPPIAPTVESMRLSLAGYAALAVLGVSLGVFSGVLRHDLDFVGSLVMLVFSIACLIGAGTIYRIWDLKRVLLAASKHYNAA